MNPRTNGDTGRTGVSHPGRALGTLASALLAGVLFVGLRTSPLSWGVPTAAASCSPRPPLFAPSSAEVLARGSSLRVETDGNSATPRLLRDGAQVPVEVQHLGGSDLLVPRKELAPGAYVLELKRWNSTQEVPFLVEDAGDSTAPIGNHLSVTEIAHAPRECLGGTLASFYAVLDVTGARDDHTTTASLAWRVWTAIPPAMPDLRTEPIATLFAPSGSLVLGQSYCSIVRVPLPDEGAVAVAVQPVDLAGNAGTVLQTTFELRPTAAPAVTTSAPSPAPVDAPAPTSPRADRSLFLAIGLRVALGLLAAAITLRLLARRA